ncbi:MAG: FecR domain-containing protein [Gammaproteobacteria bacterium]
MIRVAPFLLVPLACDSAMVDRMIKPGPPPSAIEVESIEVIPLERPHERRQLALRRGDPLSVDAQTFAIVRYTNGSVVYVRPGSRVRLGSISVDLGAIFAKVRGAFLRGAFQVDTEFVIAGAQGTEYEVKVDARNSVSVTVLEGQVLCTSKTGRWRSFVMSAGQKVNILGSAARDAASDDDIREIRRWVARLEATDRLPRERPERRERIGIERAERQLRERSERAETPEHRE